MTNNYLKKLLVKSLLIAVIAPFCANAQDPYTVESIPYQVYEGNLPIQYTTDDVYTDVMDLPFNFTFYGNTYNQFLVSTNGYIDFRTDLANEWSPYALNMPIPAGNFPVKSSILGCYHDMNNQSNVGGNGTMTWSVTGDAPYRKAVFLYTDQPHFGVSCETTTSTFQIIIYETINYIDVQITKKGLCTAWQNGTALVGLINSTGLEAIAAPGRNTGAWEVALGEGEGWRFKPFAEPQYRYIKCDEDTDGIEAFDFSVIEADLSASAVFYLTEADAEQQVNPLSGTSYTNTVAFEDTILYANVNGIVLPVTLSMVDCSLLFDNDNVAALDEDLNNDGNLANDDTDSDGIPDFADNDDDGDLVLTSLEYVFGRNTTDGYLDTDNDGIPNYLDNDDDNDGVLTVDEDYNHNGDASDDDTNGNSIPDYLEAAVALGVDAVPALSKNINLYPNPATDILNISNAKGKVISEIAVYSVNGVKVKQITEGNSVNVNDLQSGLYLVQVKVENQVLNYKFIKK